MPVACLVLICHLSEMLPFISISKLHAGQFQERDALYTPLTPMTDLNSHNFRVLEPGYLREGIKQCIQKTNDPSN